MMFRGVKKLNFCGPVDFVCFGNSLKDGIGLKEDMSAFPKTCFLTI